MQKKLRTEAYKKKKRVAEETPDEILGIYEAMSEPMDQMALVNRNTPTSDSISASRAAVAAPAREREAVAQFAPAEQDEIVEVQKSPDNRTMLNHTSLLFTQN